jgi:ribosome recycling factor
VAIRNIRRKGITDVEAMKAAVGEDDMARGEKEIEALTKHHIEAIDDALKKKESELLEV